MARRPKKEKLEGDGSGEKLPDADQSEKVSKPKKENPAKRNAEADYENHRKFAKFKGVK